jgi:tetratricopeptide (TPR) repeat protein
MELKEDVNYVPTICLNMIVKNESKIIRRLFESVLPIIDTYCICDTGSTDNTVELIQSFFDSKNIKGSIVFEPFKDFSHNRNFALQSCLGLTDFILLLDADMVLDVGNFNKKMLNDYDVCNILQGNDNFYYQNTRILKNNGLFSYIGVTHEYISSPNGTRTLSLKKGELFISDLGDGGCKSDKFERDVRLLEGAIKLEPNHDRYHFYLANSYLDLGNTEKAIENYEKRIQIGGWEQEVWYSYYKLGHCHKKMGNIEKAISVWMGGYDFLPQRIENLYEIVYHYRVISKHKLANLFYQAAKDMIKLNLNRDEYLFLHNDVYTYKLDFEFTIIASYLGVKNINNEVVQIMNKCDDSGTKDNLLRNMKFYKDILQSNHVLKFDDTIEKEVNGKMVKFRSSSSCLVPNNDKTGYLMNVRYVNYYIDNGGGYLDCNDHIITMNRFIELTNDYIVTNDKYFEITDPTRRYVGIEDIRIFNDVNTQELLFLGTGQHQNNNLGIVYGKYDTDNKILEFKELKASFVDNSCEKNWVYVDYKSFQFSAPLINAHSGAFSSAKSDCAMRIFNAQRCKKSTHIIYKWCPLQICEIDKEKNSINLVEEKQMPKIFNRARGSTCGVKYSNKQTNQGEIWFILHIVSYEQPRHYYDMFAIFDESLNLLRYSAPFKYEDVPIQYCIGLVVKDDSVMINYSTWDRTTRIGVYNKKNIDSIVKYTPE